MGLTPVCPSELTELEWITESEQSIEEFWSKVHVVSPPPTFHKKGLKQHAWKANAWYLHGDSNQLTIASKKGQNGWKMLSKVDLSTFPVCINLHLTGIIVTVGGMPVDLGFPGGMDFQAIKAKGLLDL
jgi:hypothetical protein